MLCRCFDLVAQACAAGCSFGTCRGCFGLLFGAVFICYVVQISGVFCCISVLVVERLCVCTGLYCCPVSWPFLQCFCSRTVIYNMLFSKQSDGKLNLNDKDNHDGDDGDSDNNIVDGNDDEDNHNNYLVVATNGN